MKRLVLTSYDFFRKNRTAFRLVLVLCFGLLAAMASRVSFEEDISRMLQMDSKTQEYRKLIQSTRLVDKLVICISDRSTNGSGPEVKMAYCDSLVKRLNTIDSTLIRKITHTPGNFPFLDVYQALLRNLPFYMEESDYEGFDSIFRADNLQEHLTQKTRQLTALSGIMIQKTLPLDPAGISAPLSLRLKKLGDASGYETVNGYFFTRDKKNLVILVEPANPANETGKNTTLIKAIEDFADELNRIESFNELECSYFGATAMSVGNARQIQRDTILTLALMCFVLILLISSVFRRIRTPFIIFLPVAFGLLFSLAIISLFKSSISLIAIGATSVLLGIAVNYPIHLLTHRLHNNNLRSVLAGLVEPMTIGSATTIGGFACLFFVKAEILHDFGLLGALGLIGAVLFSLIFLPHLIGRQGENVSGRWLEKTAGLKFESNRYVILIVILLTPVFLYFSQFIQFDSDLMNLNYVSPRLERTEKILRGNESRKHPVYIISYGKDFDQAVASAGNIKRLSDSLSQAGLDISYTGAGDFLISEAEQQIRLSRWKNYFTPEKIEHIKRNLLEAGKKTGFKESAFNAFYKTLEVPSGKVDSTDLQLINNVFARETVNITPEMTTIVSVMSIPSGARPEIEQLLEIQPDARMIDNKYLSEQLAAIITADFNFIALFTSVLVFVALLLTYGRIELALAAFLPMVVSWIWILGLMGMFDIRFNVVNIILSTFIFGLGDDYCIFTMDGLLQGYRNKTKQLPVIRMGILLSGLTALTGFGSMIVARHPALQSIALVSVIGITSVLVISQVLIPFIFNTFVTRPVSRGASPITLAALARTTAVYLLFAAVALLLCIAGIVLLIIGLPGRKHGQMLFNRLTAKAASLLLHLLMPFRMVSPGPGDRKLPAGLVLVDGEPSFANLLALCSINRGNLTIFADKPLKLPLIGLLAKQAGHHHHPQGQADYELLRNAAASGKSAIVFTGNQGAANTEELQQIAGIIDFAVKNSIVITPVVFHHSRQVKGSGCPIVSDNMLTVIVPEQSEPKAGRDFNAEAADSGASHRMFDELRNQAESLMQHPANCRKRLTGNYVFKGPGVESSLRAFLRAEKESEFINSLLPAKGNVVVAGSGFGFLPYLLACCNPGLKVTGMEADRDMHETAVNGHDLPTNLSFVHCHGPIIPGHQATCLIIQHPESILRNPEGTAWLAGLASQLLPGGMLMVYHGSEGGLLQTPAGKLPAAFRRKAGPPPDLPGQLTEIIQNLGYVADPVYPLSGRATGLLLYRKLAD